MKKFLLSIIILLFSYGCQTASDTGKVLTNKLINNRDEFLIKKKDPLNLPPNYSELPEPNTIKQNKNNKSELEKIFQIEKNKTIKKETGNLEQVILEKIKN